MQTQGNYRLGMLIMAGTAALACCLLALAAAQPAQAAFPGNNGKIAYGRAFDSWTKSASFASPETKLLDDASGVSYSPDGSRVAFVRRSPGPEIFVGRADGSGTPTKLTSNAVVDGEPAWSPDGTQIVYRSGSHIWRMDADGSDKTALTSTELPTDDPSFDPAQPSFSPAWSVPLTGAPDGKIAFVHQGWLWTMLPDGGGKGEISYTCPTENGGVCDSVAANPNFSPDGTEVAANYYGDIFVVPTAGGPSRVLLPGPDNKYPGQELDPAWSPDGTKIAFEHNGNVGGSSYGIYVANADGSSTQAVQVTAKTGEADPDWQQDSISPTVKKASPTGRRVSSRANVTATFSEEMDPATLDGTTFKLVKKGSTKELAASVSYSAATAKATLNPTRNLKSGATYRATITAGAKDAAGNALVAKSWGFKVR